MTLHVRVSNVPRGQKAKRWVNGFTPLPMVRRLTAGRTRRSTVPHVLSVEKKDKVTAGANRSTSRRIDPFCGISRTVRRATRGRAHSLTRRAAGPGRHRASEPPLRDRCAPRRRARNNFVHDSQVFQILRGNFHGRRGGFRLRRIAPNNRGATFRRNHRVEAVFEDVHFVADGNRQRATRAAFARYGHDDRHGQPRHFAQIPGDRFALPAFFRIDPRVRALCVDEAENRPRELRRELHYAQGFAITLRLRLAKVSREPLLGVASFLMADHRHGPTMVFRKPSNNGLIVGEAAIAMQLHEVGEKIIDKVQRIRTLLVPRDLRALPGPQMDVKLPSQLGDLLADAFQLGVRFSVARQAPQFLDVFLEMLDHLLPFFELVFFFRSHAPTGATACSPQTCRIASTNSGDGFTRCCARITATEPSGRHNSNTTGQLPGECAISAFNWSIAGSLSFRKSRRTRNSPLAGRSEISWSSRASCNESRVPASSTCTRTFISSGLPGFSICSERAKLSGKASNS